MDPRAEALSRGFAIRAAQLVKEANALPAIGAAAKAPIVDAAEWALNHAEGLKNLGRFNDPTSSFQRIISRILSGDGEFYNARHAMDAHLNGAPVTGSSTLSNPFSDPKLLDNSLAAMGATVRKRMGLAKKIGYGAAGGVGLGVPAYMAGSNQGHRKERHQIGETTNTYMQHAPLAKRLSLAFNSIFRPKATGDQIQQALNY